MQPKPIQPYFPCILSHIYHLSPCYFPHQATVIPTFSRTKPDISAVRHL